MQFEIVRKPNRLAGKKKVVEIGTTKSPPSRNAGEKAQFLMDRHGSAEAALGFAKERLFYHGEGSNTHHFWTAVAAVLKRYCTGKKDGDHRRGRGVLKIDKKLVYSKTPEFIRAGLTPIPVTQPSRARSYTGRGSQPLPAAQRNPSSADG